MMQVFHSFFVISKENWFHPICHDD
jgi:hypothetical protein